NIGQATITMDYMPGVATTFSTNEETGEYKVDLIPLSYTINGGTGVKILSNPGLAVLDADKTETVYLSEVPDTTNSEYVDPTETTVLSDPYHFVNSFTYRSIPVLNVVSQSSDL